MMEENPSPPVRRNYYENWPWWFKVAQKAACVVSGLICCALGLFVLITFHASCIVSGIFQILIGFTVIVFEAPCCCAFLDFIDQIGKFSDSRPPWQKAILYCIPPIIPMALCPEASTISGNVLVMVCGFSFLYMALGKKASREEMMERARTSQSTSNLANNAEPMATAPPPSTVNQIV